MLQYMPLAISSQGCHYYYCALFYRSCLLKNKSTFKTINQNQTVTMKKFFLAAFAAITLFIALGCTKNAAEFAEVRTPRTNPVPDELVGRWAIVGISGSTVYDIPSGYTSNTSEWFLGYEIKKD